MTTAAANQNPSLTMWNSDTVIPFTPFGSTAASNSLEYFLGTPEIETDVGLLFYNKDLNLFNFL